MHNMPERQAFSKFTTTTIHSPYIVYIYTMMEFMALLLMYKRQKDFVGEPLHCNHWKCLMSKEVN